MYNFEKVTDSNLETAILKMQVGLNRKLYRKNIICENLYVRAEEILFAELTGVSSRVKI